mgnify:FL=1|tara:strand:- start:145 stop:744 length:600 start_codon:yes stop_codon:yes gene_type:complete
MDKKSYTQISLIIIMLIIISYVYFAYFKSSKEKIIKNANDNFDKKITKGSDDLISDMSYFSEDNKGNRYEIFSEFGTINSGESNLIFMEKVSAVVYLSNGEKVSINSKKAKYNDGNNDTSFIGTVKMIYGEHVINSEYLDLSFKNQTANLYDNVKYKNNFSNLSADKIFLDLVSKNTKIQMNDEENNILVRSVINNGNN